MEAKKVPLQKLPKAECAGKFSFQVHVESKAGYIQNCLCYALKFPRLGLVSALLILRILYDTIAARSIVEGLGPTYRQLRVIFLVWGSGRQHAGRRAYGVT